MSIIVDNTLLFPVTGRFSTNTVDNSLLVENTSSDGIFELQVIVDSILVDEISIGSCY